ncbi:MAG TPA: hypothetical protein VGG74_25640 [Kofleriaceae bacterium]|jgi:hypothetical protein
MKLFSALLVTAALATPVRADTFNIETFLSWFDKLADNAVADQNDCAKMAADINKSVNDNQALIQAAQQAHKNGQQFTQAQLKRVMTDGQKIAQAMVAKCAQDQGVQAAIKRLPGRPQK